MPNWCSNYVEINHEDSTKIDELVNELEKEESELFQFIKPRPKEYDTGEAWYGWNCENWGTKWDASIGSWDRKDDNTLSINMDTAWSPPINIFEELYNQGYGVKAFYIEEGMAFAGKFEDGSDWFYAYGDGEPIDPEVDEFWGISERAEEQRLDNEREEFVDYLHTLERTEWIKFSKKTSPVRVGLYEVKTKSWPYPNFVHWDGSKWMSVDYHTFEPVFEFTNKVTEWSGITEGQNALCELTAKLSVMLEEQE